MSGLPRSITQGVFALGVFASLGFGVRQVVASPASAAPPPYCILGECNQSCVAAGGEAGLCDRVYGCVCVY